MWTRAEGFWLRFDAGLWDELLDETERPRCVGIRARRHADRHRGRPLSRAGAGHRGAADAALELVGSFLARRPPDRGPSGARRPHSPWRSWRTPRPATRRGHGLRRGFDAATGRRPDGVPRDLLAGDRPRGVVAAGDPTSRNGSLGTGPCFVGAPSSPWLLPAPCWPRLEVSIERRATGFARDRGGRGKRGAAASRRRTPLPASARSLRALGRDRGSGGGRDDRAERDLRLARRADQPWGVTSAPGAERSMGWWR